MAQTSTRMQYQATKKRRKTVLPFFPVVAAAMALAVFAFASLYTGDGALALMDAAALTSEEPQQREPAAPAPAQKLAGPILAALSGTAQEAAPAAAVNSEKANRDGRMFPYLENGKWGYKDPAGVKAITASFDAAKEFGKGLYAFAAVKDGNGALRWGLITRQGLWQVQPQYSSVRAYSENRAAVEKNSKWGYLDLSGKLVIEATYREAGDFSCGRAAVRTGSYWGYIDIDGDMAVSANWDDAGLFVNDMAFTTQSGKQYIINKVGEKITTMGNLRGSVYSEGFACIENENDTYSFFNTARDRAFKQTYEAAKDFSDGHAAVRVNGRWGYITNTGVEAIAPRFTDAGPYSQSRAAVRDDSGKWGYIDKAGDTLVPFLYDEAEPFYLNYALVKKGNIVGVVDRDGNYAELY